MIALPQVSDEIHDGSRSLRVATFVLTIPALEQTAALVEGKVTPRLSDLLDSIKDEKKVSLAVADPKLGT